MRLRHSVSLLALTMLWAAPDARADAAAEAMIRDVINRMDAAPGWDARAAAVTSEGADTVVRGLEVRSTDGKSSVAVERLAFAALGSRQGGGFTADTVTLDTAKVDLGPIRYEVPSLSAKAVAVPNLAAVAFDAEHPMASITRLYGGLADVDADEIRVPTVSYSQTVAVPGATSSGTGETSDDASRNRATTDSPASIEASGGYTDMLISNWHDGVIASQTVGRMEARSRGAGQSFDMTVEGVSAERVDMAAFAHVWDDAAYKDGRGDGVWRGVMSSFRYGPITMRFNDGAGEMRIASITAEGLDVRQPERPFARLLDDAIRMGDDPKAAATFAKEFLPLMAQSMRARSVALSGFALTSTKDQPVTMEVSRIALSDLSNEGLGRFEISGTKVDTDQADIGVDRFEIGGLRVGSLATLIGLGELAEEAEASPERKKEIDARIGAQVLDVIPTYDRIAVSGVSVEMPGMAPLTLANYVVDVTSRLKSLPMGTTASLRQLVVPGALLRSTPQAAEAFDTLGYDRLVFEADGRSTWEEGTGKTVATARYAVKDAATVGLDYAIGGVTEAWLTEAISASASGGSDEEVGMAVLDGLSLASAAVSIEDHSIVERAFRLLAKQQGTDPAAAREQIRGAVPYFVSQLQLSPTLRDKAAAALQRFLDGGMTLKVSVAPASPLTFVSAMGLAGQTPAAIAEALGVDITVEPVRN